MNQSEHQPEKDPNVEAAALHTVFAYHERSKHQWHRSANAPGYMDWASQPDPFRRYAGAPYHQLPLMADAGDVRYEQLYLPDALPARPLTLDSLSLFFRHALSLTAWKEANGSRWALRANPSSGNLHPTEGYALLPALPGLRDTPALYHYAPVTHGLECRAEFDPAAFGEFVSSLPTGSFVVGLTSIYWREAWKYGERAFRYCQHDIGHALAALRFAAALLGWKVSLVSGGDPNQDLFGVARLSAPRVEPEVTELYALVRTTADSLSTGSSPVLAGSERLTASATWRGVPNILSPIHRFAWPAIDAVDLASRPTGTLPTEEAFPGFPSLAELHQHVESEETAGASPIILGRRSAVDMDGAHSLAAPAFFRMLARLIPTRDRRAIPFDTLPWTPRLQLVVFVHRVVGLEAGLYALVRDPGKLDALKAAMTNDFRWDTVPGCPAGLPLYLLKPGDVREVAKAVSCGQDIAGDGVFSLGMIAEFTASLRRFGPSFYRALFWEAGMVGQVLYLEAEAAGVRATGIGCFFDDPVHEVFGLADHAWQSLYHLAVGHPVDDPRLLTLPGYEPTAGAG